ncbi:MAG: YcxB family protein [Chitinophagales bacterium]
MKLTVQITRQEYYEFTKYHFYHTQFKKNVISMVIMVAVLEIVLSLNGFNLFATIISVIGAGLFYYFAISRILKRAKNVPDNDGAILGENVYTFNEEQILFNSQNSEAVHRWQVIKSFKGAAKAYYLFMDSNMAIVIPKRVFSNPEEETEFKALVQRKLLSNLQTP